MLESERLKTLYSYKVLDTGADQAFEDIVDAVRHILKVPIAYISLIDANRQWFKARRGIAMTETPRANSFCNETILQSDPHVVENTIEHELYRSNPFVVGHPYVRFYIGVPIISSEGAALGAVCGVDTISRYANDSEIKIMMLYARQVAILLELHRDRVAGLGGGINDGIRSLRRTILAA
jgi:GAF domain-containing protein